jgi:Serine/threonine protein kinase
MKRLISAEHVAAAFPEMEVAPEPLGIGGYKVAFRVRHDGAEKVLKVVLDDTTRPPDWGEDDETDQDPETPSERFAREMAGMEALDSRHVAKLLTRPEERQINGNPHLWYLEHFYSGGTLRQRLSTGPLDEGEVVRLGIGLLSAVDTMWGSQRIVHRDINPNNVVYDECGEPVLIDLGSALFTQMADVTESGLTGPGTNRYAAPEQYKVRAHSAELITPRTDMFLIAIVMFEALTGRHPFFPAGTGLTNYMERLENFDELQFDSISCHPMLREVICRMLNGKPSRRYKSVEEPLAALRSLQ